MAASSSLPLILLAEDKVMQRNLIRSYLQGCGYEVLAAADGNKAIELSRSNPGDIAAFLTAVEMPKVDGISAYRHISRERPNMKVLFMSVDGTSTGLRLPKPWSLLKSFAGDLLSAELKEILEERGSITGADFRVILVVDHDAERRDRTQKILTDNGYAVLTADSVEQAETVSDSIATIDLIVSGIVFDGDSGVHLAEHVEASERKVSTLLISHFHPNILREMPGFSRQPEFLPNPFTPEALLTRVRRLLDTRQ